jgi:dolichyl-phosphate beta-glucosyltransferase
LRKHLPGLLDYLRLRNIQYEMLIVDDGSEDGGETESIVLAQGCIYLAHSKNLGKGAAVRKGMLHAKGDYKIYTDVDIPFEYEAIERFLHYLEFKEFDVVIGDRNLKDSRYFKEIQPLRKWSSKLFTFIVGRFVTTSLMDTQCGIKGFRAAIADDLFSVSRVNGFAFDVEILYIALKRNYDIKRLPVKLRGKTGTSFNLIRQAPAMIIDVLSLKINHLKGRYDQGYK